jgi:hypothetical protein
MENELGWAKDNPEIVETYNRLKAFGLRSVSPENVDRIVQSIEELGNLSETFPIEVDPQGTILSGRHRKSVGRRLGFEWPERLVPTTSYKESLEIALAANRADPWSEAVLRREMVCLNRLKKNELIIEALKEDDARDEHQSNSEIGRELGINHETVAARRAELEATCGIRRWENKGGGNHTGPAPSKPREPVPIMTEAQIQDLPPDEFEVFCADLLMRFEGEEEIGISKFRKFGARALADRMERLHGNA